MSSEKLKILIVEDELLIASHLKMLLEQFGYTVMDIAQTYEDALTKVKLFQPDLVLLDIILKGPKDGIDLANELNKQHLPFVYITSHTDKSTLERAKLTLPKGYVVKPFNKKDLYAALEMVSFQISLKEELENEDDGLYGQQIPIKSGYDTIIVKVNQIDFIKANGVYLEVYYGKEKVLTRSNIPNFIDKLPEDQFCRIHKSYVINMKKIKVISPKFVEISDEQIPIGRQYKSGFFEALEKLNM
jgi:DNA-binding LytR/AlgR family response regulator